MKIKIWLIASIVLLAACSSSPHMNRQEKSQAYDDFVIQQKLESVDRVTTFRYHGWRELDGERLIIESSGSRYYLLTLRGFCVDLEFARGIAVKQQGSTLRAGFDWIYPSSDPGQRCYIKAIYPLTKTQADEMSRIGKSPKSTPSESSDN